MGAQFSVAVILKAVDRATAPINRVSAAMQRATQPFRVVQNSIKQLSESAGFPRLSSAVSGTADALGNLGSKLRRIALLGTAAVSAIAVTSYKLVDSFLKWGHEIGDTSTRLGISAEQLQEWRRAAKLAGLGNEALTTSLQRLSVNAVNVRRGDRGATDSFRSLGINALDAHGKVRPLSQLLPEVADKLRGLSNPMQRTATAVRLFGKSGGELIPMLMEGSKGLAAAARSGRQLGLIWSNDQIKKVGEMADAFDEAVETVLSLTKTIGGAMAPTVVDLAKKMRDWVVENRGTVEKWARSFAESLPSALKKVGEAFEQLKRLFKPFVALWDGLSAAIGPVPAALLLVAGALSLSLVPAVLSTISALATLSAALVATPAGWVVLALTAVAAAFAVVASGIALLVVNWDQISARFPRLAALAEKLGLALLKHLVHPILLVIAAVTKLLEWLEKLAQLLPDSAFQFVGIDVKKLTPGKSAATQTEQIGAGSGLPFQLRDLNDWLQRAGAPHQRERTHDELAGAARFADVAGIPFRRESRASVSVDFKNVPRGVTVKPAPGNDVDLDLSLGYSMFSP